MFGTAFDKFGEGRFGHSDWGLITVYNSMPRMHRQLDEDLGSPLRKLYKAIEDELERERLAIGDLVDQRDPILARAGSSSVFDISLIADNGDGTSTVTLTSDHDLEAGNFINFAGVSTGAPFVVGEYTIKEIASPSNTLLATQFTIVQTLTVNATDGKVKLKDRRSTLVEIESYSEYTTPYKVDQKDGPMVELTVAPGVDLEMIGVGYLAELVLTSPISPGAPSTSQVTTSQYSFKVLRITRRNDPESRDVLLCEGRPFSSGSLPSPIVLNFVQPNLLLDLTRDFGIEPDDNLPVSFQRSNAKNVTEFIQLKSSAKGYQIRSEESGFKATVQGLFSLCRDPGLPPSSVHHIVDPYNSSITRMYTEIEPRVVSYDELSADIEGVDYETGDAVYLTDQYAFDDTTRPFGQSPLKSFFNRIFSANVTSTSPVPQSVLDSIGLPYGQYVSGYISPSDRAMIGDISSKNFSLTGPHAAAPTPPTGFSPANIFPVEAEETYDPATGLFKWVVGVPSTVTIPLTGGPFTEYYLAYEPPVAEDCCWCKSHVVRLLLEPTAEFMASGSYTGAQVAAAIQRLVERIKNEQLPIHARLGEVVLAQSVALNWPSIAVSISSVQHTRAFTVSATFMYDVVAADEVATDMSKNVNVSVATSPPGGQLVFDNTRPGNPWLAVIGL